MAVHIYDQYLNKSKVDRSHLVFVFVTTLFIAAKYEEVKIVRLKNFLSQVQNESCTPDAIFETERLVLEKLNYKLNYVCPYDFLKRIFHITKTDIDKCELIRFDGLLLFGVFHV